LIPHFGGGDMVVVTETRYDVTRWPLHNTFRHQQSCTNEYQWITHYLLNWLHECISK